VRGVILESNGEQLELEITALDASGRQWLNRSYAAEIAPQLYRQGGTRKGEAFQPLYNAIANDLAEVRQSLPAADNATIRQVAKLRFAADLAPEAFADDLQVDGRGRYTIVHLPAADDPMLQRVLAIRERDLLLIDTLNGHYDNFSRSMESPYNEWRKSRSEEAAALRKIEHDAMKRKLIVLGGAYAIKSGFDMDSETGIHRDAIIELDESFSAEARPLVVDVEGETHELTGSAEVQYAKWRALLKRIYASETGFTTL